MQAKGSLVRSYLKWLTREKALEGVLARVGSASAALLLDPPLANTWIDSDPLVEIVVALEHERGLDGVRKLARDTIVEDAMPVHRQILTSVLRMFGTSPATLYRRMNELVKTSVRGIDYAYTPTSDRSGMMVVSYHAEKMPLCSFVSGAAALEAILLICNSDGTVGEPVRTGPSTASYTIRW